MAGRENVGRSRWVGIVVGTAALLAVGGAGPAAASWDGTADGGSISPDEGDLHTQILGGTVDRQRGVGWVSALLKKGPGTRFERQFCGGSLVAKRWVLTAAHCVRGPTIPARRLQALIGTKKLNRGGQLLNVRAVRVYPRYSGATNFGDMALLRLAASARPRTVGLVAAGTHYVGQLGYIAGWGSLTGGSTYPTTLRSTFIPIQPDGRCISGGGIFDPHYAPSVMLCAGLQSGARDTCPGDSGGPLARRVSGRWRLVGVTSYTKRGPCGQTNAYGVYAWVGSSILRGWLRRNVGF